MRARTWRQDWALTPPTSDDEEGRVQGECGLEQTCRISLPGLKLLDFWCCWLENGINRRWAGWVWYQHIHTHVGSGAWVLKAKTSFSESEMDYLPCQPDLASCPPGRSFLQAGCVQGHRGVGITFVVSICWEPAQTRLAQSVCSVMTFTQRPEKP